MVSLVRSALHWRILRLPLRLISSLINFGDQRLPSKMLIPTAMIQFKTPRGHRVTEATEVLQSTPRDNQLSPVLLLQSWRSSSGRIISNLRPRVTIRSLGVGHMRAFRMQLVKPAAQEYF